MSHGPTKIKTKAVCIYCNRAVPNLTDEHIIPLSLGGQHVIQKASCPNCADITKKFEQNIARDLWGDARISFDAPSRRKKERPSHITLSVHGGRFRDVHKKINNAFNRLNYIVIF